MEENEWYGVGRFRRRLARSKFHKGGKVIVAVVEEMETGLDGKMKRALIETKEPLTEKEWLEIEGKISDPANR